MNLCKFKCLEEIQPLALLVEFGWYQIYLKVKFNLFSFHFIQVHTQLFYYVRIFFPGNLKIICNILIDQLLVAYKDIFIYNLMTHFSTTVDVILWLIWLNYLQIWWRVVFKINVSNKYEIYDLKFMMKLITFSERWSEFLSTYF